MPAATMHPDAGAPPVDSSPVVEGTGLVKRWGSTTVFRGADLTIGPGVTGLLGSNGSGKTTLFGMLLGLHHPESGRLRVLGLDPAKAGPAIRARIGYSPEHHRVAPDVRVHDLVRHIGEIHGLPRRVAVNRASDVLWQVGLGEERFRPLGTMSTGQRQRAKLAQAIVHDPDLILLDEPTDGLDPVQRDDMLALIRRVGSEFGIHVLLSSHQLEEVEQVCDGAVILRDGVVAAAGTITALRGTSRGIDLELDGDEADLAAVAAELRRHRLEVTDLGRRLTVLPPEATTDADELNDVVRDVLAAAPRVGLRRLTARTTTLEDVFLGLDS